MRMLGGESTGEATGSAAADRVRNALREAACPAEEAPSWPGGTGRMAGGQWLSELLQWYGCGGLLHVKGKAVHRLAIMIS